MTNPEIEDFRNKGYSVDIVERILPKCTRKYPYKGSGMSIKVVRELNKKSRKQELLERHVVVIRKIGELMKEVDDLFKKSAISVSIASTPLIISDIKADRCCPEQQYLSAYLPVHLPVYLPVIKHGSLRISTHNEVACAGFAFAATHTLQVGQLSPERNQTVHLQRGAHLTLYDIEDFRRRHPLGILVERILRYREAEVEILVGGFLHLVAAVPEHYLLGLRLVEPAAVSVAQQLQRLGEELAMVGHTGGVDRRCQFDADEATVARRVGEDVGHVARGDERCLARQFLDACAIGTFRLYRGQLYDVLQKALLHARRYLVELVEVDEQLLRHGEHHLSAVGDGKTVGVAPP